MHEHHPSEAPWCAAGRGPIEELIGLARDTRKAQTRGEALNSWHTPRVPVYTASYEGRSLDEFLTDLRANGVRLVADVREAPISRKPGFSKSSLAAALERAGIAYCHIRALGCPKPVRDAYRKDGDWVRYTRSFLNHLSRQQAAIQDLVGLTKAQPTALLCYETDFNRCHRTFVARAVAEQAGSRVCHITAAGLVREAAGRAA